MKFLKILGILIAVVFLGYTGYMATLDGKFDVSRSVQISSNPTSVYNIVSDLETWPEWSTWYLSDTTMTASYGEQTTGEGASYSWTSDVSGNGKLTIMSADPGKSMTTKIEFEGMGSSDGYWTFEEKDGGTFLTWGFKGELPFFFRSLAAGMDSQVGPDFEAGLENIREMAEAGDSEFFTMDAMAFEGRQYLGITVEGKISEMSSDVYANGYGEIMAYLGGPDKAINAITGPPFAIYHTWEPDSDHFIMEVAIPAVTDLPGNDRVVKGQSYEGTAIFIDHYGAYDQTVNAHEDISEFIEMNGYQYNGSPMEIYVTDPMEEPDTSKWLTKVVYPAKKMDEGTTTTDKMVEEVIEAEATEE